MNIGEYSIKAPVVSWLLVIIMVVGGFVGFEKMGKLEDPNFTIKKAKIITYYPGATAQQVQDEITYHRGVPTFAKAHFGHPCPSSRQKLNGTD